MNLDQTIKKLSRIFSKNCDDVTRSKRFLTSIITTHVFSKMSVPEKLTSITKLMNLLKCDHGVASKELEEALLSLSEDLKHQELNHLYSISDESHE
jgi:hypothetical protein